MGSRTSADRSTPRKRGPWPTASRRGAPPSRAETDKSDDSYQPEALWYHSGTVCIAWKFPRCRQFSQHGHVGIDEQNKIKSGETATRTVRIRHLTSRCLANRVCHRSRDLPRNVTRHGCNAPRSCWSAGRRRVARFLWRNTESEQSEYDDADATRTRRRCRRFTLRSNCSTASRSDPRRSKTA